MGFEELKGVLKSRDGMLMFNRAFDGKFIYNGLLKRNILNPKLATQPAGTANNPANATKSFVKQLEDDFNF